MSELARQTYETTTPVPRVVRAGRPHPLVLFFGFVAASLPLGFFVFIGMYVWQYGDLLRERGREHVLSVAAVVAEQTARLTQVVDYDLLAVIERLGDAPDERADGTRRLHDYLRNKIEQSRDITDLFVVGADGRIAHTAQQFPSERLDVSDRPYFVIHRHDPDHGLYISPAMSSRLNGQSIVVISRRMNGPNGAFAGVAAAAVRIEALNHALGSVKFGMNTVISVFLESGPLLLRTPPSDDAAPPDFFGSSHLLPTRGDGTAFATSDTVDGVRRIYAIRRVPAVPAYVLAGIGEDELLAAWRDELRRYIFLGILVIFATTAFAGTTLWYLSRREALLRALTASEQRFRDFAEAASDRFWETDGQHRLIWHSGLGDRKPPYLGKTRWEHFGIDAERDPLWRRHKADLEARRPFRGFRYTRHKNGRRLHRIVSGKPHFAEDGRFLGYRGTYADVTKQVLEEERMQRMRERFLRSIESLSEGFALYDAEDRLVVCNRRFRAVYAGAGEALSPGSTFESLMRSAVALGAIPEARGRETEWFAQRLAQRRRLPNDIEVERQGRWVQIRERRDDDGGTIMLIIDIHDRKLAELQRAALDARLRMFFERMPVGCVIIDQERRVCDWNPMAERIFGHAKTELLGEVLESVIVPPEAGKTAGAADPAAEPAAFEPQLNMTKDDRRILCEWRNTPLFDSDGRRIGTLGMVADVTEKRKSEEKLRQTTRMEAMGQLTGGVAHDFNNLLQVILGNAEILMEGLADRPDLRRWAETSKRAADRGAELTARLLAYARRQTLQPTSFDLNAAIADMRHLIERTVNADIRIRLDLAADLWPAHIDPGQIDHALLNLVINARDAMPDGGTLTVATVNVHLDAQDVGIDGTPGDYVRLTVADDGIGMSGETMSRAFEPFFTTKGIGKGSGLGLSMVHGFVAQSGGLVRLASEPCRGTVVSLYLPRARGTATAASAGEAADETPPADGARKTILVVEDDDLVRSFVSAQLAELGYAIVEAADGSAALRELARNDSIDLLFTDIVMPGGMNGRQLAERARARRPQLKVLFTSGYDKAAIAAEERLTAGAGLLKKPYQRRELAAKIRDALECAADGSPSPPQPVPARVR